MGFIDWLLGTPAPSSVTPASTAIASPWSSTQLNTLVWSDVFGGEAQVMTRAEALSLPAVNKATAIMKSLIADKPLRAYKGDELAPVQPTFLYRTDGDVSPWLRMAGTIDDLIFYGWSLWAVERGAAGQITAAVHVPFDRWQFDTDGRVLVTSGGGKPQPVDARSVILIPGPNDGLLTHASRSLRGAAAIEGAWVERARNPIPQVNLHLTEEAGIELAEAQQLVKDWDLARQTGATAFTPHNVDAIAMGQLSPDLFTEGRNNSRLDVANFFNLPAALLDGSVSTASLTYSTQEGDRNEVYDYCLPYWVGAIEGRLSQDDVVPAGQRVRFDFSTLLNSPQSPTGAITED